MNEVAHPATFRDTTQSDWSRRAQREREDGASLREAQQGEAVEDFLEGHSLSAAPPKQVRATNVRAPLLTKKRREKNWR